MSDELISPPDIDAAWDRISPFVRVTPCVELDVGGVAFTGKLEFMQHGGSFKARGAYNTLLSHDLTEAGVAAASGGNFGIAIAHAAQRLGHRATIFVPEITSEAKRARLTSLGAEVVVVGAVYDHAREECESYALRTGALVAHAYDRPATVAGAGTCARELDRQCAVDTVLVAVGGGGLIGGVAAWFGDRVRVIGVETETTPTLAAARAAGGPVHVDVSGLAADALGASRLGEIAWQITDRYVDDSLVVTDAAVAAAQRELWSSARIVTEPAGATALGALMSGAYRPAPGERVAVLLCGANTDGVPR